MARSDKWMVYGRDNQVVSRHRRKSTAKTAAKKYYIGLKRPGGYRIASDDQTHAVWGEPRPRERGRTREELERG